MKKDDANVGILESKRGVAVAIPRKPNRISATPLSIVNTPMAPLELR